MAAGKLGFELLPLSFYLLNALRIGPHTLVGLQEQISKIRGTPPSTGSLHGTISRLKKEGFLEVGIIAGEVVDTPVTVKQYSLTQRGEKALNSANRKLLSDVRHMGIAPTPA